MMNSVQGETWKAEEHDEDEALLGAEAEPGDGENDDLPDEEDDE